MPDELDYHEARAAQERAAAAGCPSDGARERHLQSAAHREDLARWLQGDVGSGFVQTADASVSAAIHQSRELIRNSHLILAESRRKRPIGESPATS